MTEKWYLKSQEEIESVLHTSAAAGLDPAAASLRLRTDGGNNLYTLKRRISFRGALRECLDFPSVLLLFVMAISGFRAETVLSMLIILISIGLRIVLYVRAMRGFAYHSTRAIPKARVVRGGRVCRVDSRRLVQGDLLYLQPGDFVPADARVIRGSVTVSEQRITGKKAPIEKKNGPVADRSNMELTALTNMVFAGARVIDGQAMAIVTDTGADTLLMSYNGRIPVCTYEKMRTVRRMSKHCTLCEMVLLGAVVLTSLLSILTGGSLIIRSFIFSLIAVTAATVEGYFALSSYVIYRSLSTLQSREGSDPTLIKDMRILELLPKVDFVLIRDTFGRDGGTKLAPTLNRLRAWGIRPILLTDRVEYGELFFAKLSCFAERKEQFLNRAKFLAATDDRLWQLSRKIRVYSCLSAEESLRLLRVLQMNGASVAVLSPRSEDTDLLREADVSISVRAAGNAQSPADEVSEAEMISDIVLPDTPSAKQMIREWVRCVRLSKLIPAKMNALFAYFLAMTVTRLILCVCGTFVSAMTLGPVAVLLGTLLPDLVFAVLLARTDSGSSGRAPDEPFRYHSYRDFQSPIVAGIAAALCAVAAWSVIRYVLNDPSGGVWYALLTAVSLSCGIFLIKRERCATTPIGWIPTVLSLLLWCGTVALLALLPPLSRFLLLGEVSWAAVGISVIVGLFQYFCQKVLFGTKILIKNY